MSTCLPVHFNKFSTSTQIPVPVVIRGLRVQLKLYISFFSSPQTVPFHAGHLTIKFHDILSISISTMHHACRDNNTQYTEVSSFVLLTSKNFECKSRVPYFLHSNQVKCTFPPCFHSLAGKSTKEVGSRIQPNQTISLSPFMQCAN